MSKFPVYRFPDWSNEYCTVRKILEYEGVDLLRRRRGPTVYSVSNIKVNACDEISNYFYSQYQDRTYSENDGWNHTRDLWGKLLKYDRTT